MEQQNWGLEKFDDSTGEKVIQVIVFPQCEIIHVFFRL
jgi:hypothetical protein